MYLEHESLTTPPDDTILWRYMDLSQFLWMLSESSLYFSALGQQTDKWEGVFPAGFWDAWRMRIFERVRSVRRTESRGTSVRDQRLRDYLNRTSGSGEGLKKAIRKLRISCWHINRDESVAMWKLYTKGVDGVAIQTTVGHLKASLSEAGRSVFIGRVFYGDHAKPVGIDFSNADQYTPLVVKRSCYQHENEVRAFLTATSNTSTADELRDDYVPSEPRGEAIKVSLTQLIQRVVCSPDLLTPFFPAIKKFIDCAGLDLKVESSDMLRKPSEIS